MAVAAVVGAAGLPVPASHAATRPMCTEIAFSPTYASDGTAFCFTWTRESVSEPVAFHVSIDRLRTWRRTDAAGLVGENGVAYGQLLVSPMFAHDRTVYFASTTVLYASTDLGETFTVVSPLAATSLDRDHLSAYVDPTVPVPGLQTVIAYGGDQPLRIIRPVHVPALGSPDEDLRFLARPGGTATDFAVVIANRDTDPGIAWRPQPVLYACDVALACGRELHAFPVGDEIRAAYLAPDFGQSGVMFVVTIDSNVPPLGERLWRSTDGGDTFTEDTSTRNWRSRLARYGSGDAMLNLVFAGGRRVYLRRATNNDRAGPVEQLLRSDDGGGTWKVVAHTGRGGRLPWTQSPYPSHVSIDAPAPGVLVAMAGNARTGYVGPYCSRDGGRSWRTTCG